MRHRDKIEAALFARIRDLFGLPITVTLYDLTNTYFEGTAAGNPKAARGRSKEKRSDCPLVTLGLVLDSSGFVRRSRMFAGNVAEAAHAAGHAQGPRRTPRRAGHHGCRHRHRSQYRLAQRTNTATLWSAASAPASSTPIRPSIR